MLYFPQLFCHIKYASCALSLFRLLERAQTAPPQGKVPKEPTTNIRDSIPRRGEGREEDEVKIVTWNVNGLRALARNKLEEMRNFVNEQAPHVLCLQETKLQEEHEECFANLFAGYQSHFSSSTKKKGYSGTALFIRSNGEEDNKEEDNEGQVQKQSSLHSFFGVGSEEKEEEEEGSPTKKKRRTNSAPLARRSSSVVTPPTLDTRVPPPITILTPLNIERGVGDSSHEGEGRVLTAEFPSFYLVNAYVPNSGMDLKRLSYRYHGERCRYIRLS